MIYPRNTKEKNVCNENRNAEDNATQELLITRRRTMAFFTISATQSDIPTSHSITDAIIITKNYFEISSKHNHAMKSIEEIVKTVLKSYHKYAHLLMKYLF